MSGPGRGFWVGALFGEEQVGGADEGDVAVPAGERAALEVVQPEASAEPGSTDPFLR